MRTKLAALSFTAAILAGILVPAFGGTASAHGSADGGPGCIGQHVRAVIAVRGSLQKGLEFQIDLVHDPDIPHVPNDSHAEPLPADTDIGGYLDFLRAHCGR